LVPIYPIYALHLASWATLLYFVRIQYHMVGFRENPGGGYEDIIRMKIPQELAKERNIAPSLSSPFVKSLKRGMDLLVSSTFIVLIFPWLLPILAFLIRLDSKGPVFFCQIRQKRAGQYFRCIKLRTMVVNSYADSQPSFPEDRRITRMGRLLRKYHIDELPQLFNVLWGDMSLIGPRPFMITDNQLFSSLVADYDLRHQVKPGITGLAQALRHSGFIPDHRSLQTRIALDHYYISHWSFALEWQILVCTLGIRSRGYLKRQINFKI
jgi:putative colanic acid biosynthesis UDP-glucose lipid carrier transferase